MERYKIKNHSMYKWWVNIYDNEEFQGKQYKHIINCFNSMFQDFLIENPQWLKTIKNRKYHFPLNWVIFNGGFLFFTNNYININLIFKCLNEIEKRIFGALFVNDWIKNFSNKNLILRNQIILEYDSDKFFKTIFVDVLNQINENLMFE